MKALKMTIIAMCDWLLISKSSERFFKYALAVAAILLFANTGIRYLIQNFL